MGVNGANGAGRPSNGNGAAPSPPEGAASLEPPPAAIAELVASCVRFIASRYKTPLDHTPDTLPLIDQYVRDARIEVRQRPEAIDLVQGAVGAYFGELARLTYGGHWLAEGDPSTWRLRLRHAYLSFNPIGVAREALLEEDAEGFGAHFEVDPGERDVVDRRLAALPPAPEDEYYTPTTRWEVLELVYLALRAHMTANGTADVEFGPDDYA